MISTVATMTLDGGEPCLDFVNSGYDRERALVTERLHSYADLLLLADRLTLFEETYLKKLRAQGLAEPEKAGQTLRSARKIRELLYRLFSGIAMDGGRSLAGGFLKEVDQLFQRALRYRILAFGDKLQLTTDVEDSGLMAPVWKWVLSAYDLLDQGNIDHIRQCQRCAWLFIDKTKSHRKKWCSMESCGNSQKTKRYYQKQRKAGEQKADQKSN